MKKKQLKLDELNVKSFVTELNQGLDKDTIVGGATGNCLSDLYTCAAGCDFKSVPLNECSGGVCIGASVVIGTIGCWTIWD